ncbi:hypothetical protein [Brevundimonas diminuta]|uniref:hypothetical protein n=1 Tax=Brevundimonas diminuta TaxID=293 RepID=UPI003D0118A0
MALDLVSVLAALVAVSCEPGAKRIAPDFDLSGPEWVAVADSLAVAAQHAHDPVLEALAVNALEQAERRTFYLNGAPAVLDVADRRERLARDLPPGHLAGRLLSDPGPPVRGREGGPSRGAYRVAAGETWRSSARFRVDENAYLYVRSTPETPIIVTVDDPEGRRVCNLGGRDGKALCRWKPASAGETVIAVRSSGDQASTVEILVN